MATIKHIPPFTGTEDLICVYKMGSKYYMRKRSNLTRERVKTDPLFAKTRQYADLLVKGSAIGSKVYRTLPADIKKHSLYRKLTGEAIQWLKYNWKEQDIIDFLRSKYMIYTPATPLTNEPVQIKTRKKWDPTTWQPVNHRRSIKAFVRNMCDQRSARKNRQYDRFLAAIG